MLVRANLPAKTLLPVSILAEATPAQRTMDATATTLVVPATITVADSAIRITAPILTRRGHTTVTTLIHTTAVMRTRTPITSPRMDMTPLRLQLCSSVLRSSASTTG